MADSGVITPSASASSLSLMGGEDDSCGEADRGGVVDSVEVDDGCGVANGCGVNGGDRPRSGGDRPDGGVALGCVKRRWPGWAS